MDTKIYSSIQRHETIGLATIFGTYVARMISFETGPLEVVANEKANSGLMGI
ncbi:MAG: hypothetical protein H0X50_09370 [Nitrosopumilus sp.]|nr:hypothetical protein [Nitrosopumilus sp.]